MKVRTQTLFAGRDFPSYFEQDLFSIRRSELSKDEILRMAPRAFLQPVTNVEFFNGRCAA